MEVSGYYSYKHGMGSYIREQKGSLDWKPYKNGYIFFMIVETFIYTSTWTVVALMERIKHQDRNKKKKKMRRKKENVEFFSIVWKETVVYDGIWFSRLKCFLGVGKRIAVISVFRNYFFPDENLVTKK